MDKSVERDIRLINTAGALGTVYFRLAFAEIFLLFVTRCLGISKETWALVAAILPVTGVFHILSAYLTERVGRRKVLSLWCFAISRLAVPAITLLPFVTGQHDKNVRIYCLTAALIAHSSISALGASAWLSWVADIVPSEYRGKFYSVRLMIVTLFDVVVFLIGGWVLDIIARQGSQLPGGEPNYADPWGYVVIFGLAFIAGEADLIIHAKVPDRPLPPREPHVTAWQMLARPWRHAGFRSLMVFRMFLAVGDGIAGPFAIMYLYDELGLTASALCAFIALFLLTNVLAYGLWGKVGERVGYRTVCSVACIASGILLLHWWFLPQGRPVAVVVVLSVVHVGFGVTWSGMNLALSTLTMNIAPDRHRSMYFAQITALLALVMGLATLCGRWIYMNVNPASDLHFLSTRITGLHTLIGLLALVRILSIPIFIRRVPDARAEAVMPRLDRILRTNPFRIFPTLLSLERPLSAKEREEHVETIREIIPASEKLGVEQALQMVIVGRALEEEEFYGIMGRERMERGKGLERMTGEIARSSASSTSAARARAAARRIERLYAKGDLAACLRTVRRMAERTRTAAPASPRAEGARAVIDALSRQDSPPVENVVLLAVYAYLQLVREQAE